MTAISGLCFKLRFKLRLHDDFTKRVGKFTGLADEKIEHLREL
jgi:hypothetical protein